MCNLDLSPGGYGIRLKNNNAGKREIPYVAARQIGVYLAGDSANQVRNLKRYLHLGLYLQAVEVFY
jgi:hypothetical protein